MDSGTACIKSKKLNGNARGVVTACRLETYMMSTKAAPMIYARVVRALAAAGGEPQPSNDLHYQRIADAVNREFERLGIHFQPEELHRKSALEIAEVITEKIGV
jgi:hypothetical protein